MVVSENNGGFTYLSDTTHGKVREFKTLSIAIVQNLVASASISPVFSL